MRKAKITIKADKKITPLDKYAGEWVAFLDNKVIESAGTLTGLMKKVEKKGLEKEVSVFLVPKKRENLIV